MDRHRQLEEKIQELAGGDALLKIRKDCPADIRDAFLEDIIAFESVGSGTPLFTGLQEHGMDLPNPKGLSEQQSADKIQEVLYALWEMRIFLIGYEGMSPREFYSTLWNETLWEGCYVRKGNPGAITIMDVSHRITRSKVQEMMDQIVRSNRIH